MHVWKGARFKAAVSELILGVLETSMCMCRDYFEILFPDLRYLHQQIQFYAHFDDVIEL
jgi:hypothetical protein